MKGRKDMSKSPFGLEGYSPTQRTFLGDGGILICAILWAASFSAVKFALRELTPLWILTGRFVLSLAILTFLAPKRWRLLSAKDWFYGALIGGAFVAALLCQAMGLIYADTGTIAFLTAGYVALLPFLLVIVGRRPAKIDFVASALCFVGMSLLTLEPGKGLVFGLGALWGVASALSAACQVLNIEIFARRAQPLNLCFTQLAVGLVLTLGAALYFEGAPQKISLPTLGVMSYLALGCTLIPFCLQLVAQPLTTPTRASLIYSLESVFAGLIGVLWLGEAFTARTALGYGLIFGAVVVAQLLAPTPRDRRDQEPDDLL